jgi:hypothetical protein
MAMGATIWPSAWNPRTLARFRPRAPRMLSKGSSSGLTNSGDQFWTQNSPNVPEVAEFAYRFGAALAAGDFDDDGFDDLAVGVPTEDGDQAGVVHVIYGTSNKLAGTDNALLSAAILGYVSSQINRFGVSLAVGDFNRDGHDDLAIGASSEDVEGQDDAGAVYVLYSQNDGVGSDAQVWNQNSEFIIDSSEPFDQFGFALTAGDYNGDGYADLVVAVPGERTNGLVSVGAVHVIFGFFVGLIEDGNHFWQQSLLSASDGDEVTDSFGFAFG